MKKSKALKLLKQPVSLLLALLMLFSVAVSAPISVSADGDEPSSSESTPTPSPESDFQWTVSGNNAIITKYIGNDANVVIPNTLGGYPVTAIYNASSNAGGAFANNQYIKSVIIPEGVTDIGDFAFYFLNYQDCNLESVTIPNSVTRIGTCAFVRCKFTSITLPNNLTSIDDWAFAEDYALTSLTIPANVSRIDGVGAFSQCTSLTNISVDPNNNNFSSLNGNLYNKNKQELIQYALGNSALSFELPSSVTKVDDYAFYNCSYLEEITVASGNTAYSAEDGVLYNKNKTRLIAYPAQKKDLSFTIPSTVSEIINFSIKYCKNLTDVVFLNNGSFTIGNNSFNGHNPDLTFYGYSGSSAQSFANSQSPKIPFIPITEYENGWLYNNGAIVDYVGEETNVTVPATVNRQAVTSIAANAFKGNENITSVTIPENITSVGANAFDGCSALTSVTFLSESASAPSIDSTAFNNHAQELTFYGYANSAAENYAGDSIPSIPFVELGGEGSSTKTIKVTATYADAVSSQIQTVEYYADTTQAATNRYAIASGASATILVDKDNTTPTLNLKSSSKVSITSIVVKDANGENITATAFGADQYKTDFLESCKTSLFGFVEFQNITGNITVEVTYGTPVVISGSSGGNPYFSYTIVTKGDVGPCGKAYLGDYNFGDMYLNTAPTTYDENTGIGPQQIEGDVFNKSGHYTMRDGGQLTRYDYRQFTIKLNDSNYFYISDVEAYYNDTGEEASFDFSNIIGMRGSRQASRVTYVLNNTTHNNRSVTFVVTYKEIPATTIYANIKKLQYANSTGKIRLEADTNGRFIEKFDSSITSSNIYNTDIVENIDPFANTSYGGANAKVKMLDSDTVKFYYGEEQSNSIDFRNFKVYALDVANNTFGEQIAGEGCTNPKVTLTYNPARDSWDDDGYVTISGLKAYGGDIYITADTYRYLRVISLRQSGNHTKSFTVTADDLGAISGAGQSGADENMNSSYTKSPEEGNTTHRMYAGGTYTVRSQDEISSLTLYYSKKNGSGGSNTTVNNFGTKNSNGSITFTLPSDFYDIYDSNAFLQVNFAPITTYEAQIYPTVGGGTVVADYTISTINQSGNNNNLVQVSTFENGEPAARLFRDNVAYRSANLNTITGSSFHGKYYYITPGTVVKIKDIFQAERRNVSDTLPEGLKNFANRRLEFKGVKVYKASNFSHDYSGSATLGDPIECTKDGDYYVFTMPNDSGVRVVPEYYHHARRVNIVSNQRNGNTTYNIGAGESQGTATLTGDENNWFIHNNWYNFSDSYITTNYGYSGYQWTKDRSYTLDGSTFTLSATPEDSYNYYVKSVKAYKYNYSSGTTVYNKISQDNLGDTTSSWLSYNSNGDITNAEIPNVVGALSEPAADGTRTCTITLPETLDVGNIALWVEFAPVDHTRFAPFEYQKDSTANAFNPPVTIKGIFENSENTSVNATNGATQSMAVYDDEESHIINVEIGGDNTKSSVFYNRALNYDIKDASNNETLAQFKIYHNQIIPAGTTTAETLANYLGTATFTASGTNGIYTKVTLPVKLTENGLKLCYTSTQPYAQLTFKQYAVDENDAPLSNVVNNNFYAQISKYPSTTDATYFANSDPYTATTPTYSGSYNAEGATDACYMKLLNGTTAQGFEFKPYCPEGYVLADVPVVKTISPDGTENTLAGVTVTDIGDNTYRVTYTGDSSGFSFMNGERIEVEITYKATDLVYVPFSYTADGSCRPKTTFIGEIAGRKLGSADATNGLYAINTAKYDEEKPNYLTMIVGGAASDTGSVSIFHETNLVYTLTDISTSSVLLKFRIYHGRVEPVPGYSQDTFDTYIHEANVTRSGLVSGLMEEATIKLKIPQSGLHMYGYAEQTYIPVTVKQYVLDNNGNATPAGNSYEADVTKFTNTTSDLARLKYFNKNDVNGDTYGLGKADASESDFINSYTVTGAADTHYMVYINASQGLYIKPKNTPEGYDFAAVQAKAYNPAGVEITNTSYKQNLTSVPESYDTNGYLIRFDSGYYMRGEKIEVEVYYRPATTLTVREEMDGVLGDGTLSEVQVSSTTSVPAPYRAYTTAGRNTMNSYTIQGTKSNIIESGEHTGSLYHTTTLGVHQGVTPRIQITPQGARTVSSVKIYKKDAGEYVEVPSTAYTVSGSGDAHAAVTYTFTSSFSFGDDYRVEIVYGRQQQMTVKAVIRTASGQETEINSAALYNQSYLDKITVTGQRYDIYGNDTQEYAFEENGTSLNSFELTSAPKTVNSDTNTRVNIQTTFKENSPYVIANIIAYNDRDSDLNLVKAGTKQVGTGANARTETTYENSTLPSLSSTDNVTVKIILTKVASVEVSVYTILDDGISVENGTLQDSNSYVNVAVNGYGVNRKAIITAKDEGAYYTDNFDITFNPHTRKVNVLEGTTLDVFAQLPGNAEYVISKITTDGTGFNNIKVGSTSRANGVFRETLNTNSTVIYAERTYKLDIYIQKARSIFTRVVADQGNGSEAYVGGTVTMRGSHPISGVIPFTKLVPSYEASPNYYNAVTNGTTEAKAIRDTNISFEVTPPSQYSIKEVTVKSGINKNTATNVAFTTSPPDSNGKVTYTVSEPMSPNSDLFVDVKFVVKEGGYVSVDFQYTDDYENYYNLFDSSENGNSTMNATVLYSSYGTRHQVAKDLVKDEEQFSWSGVRYSESDLEAKNLDKYKFYVAAGNTFRVAATQYLNGKWYVAIEGECGIYRNGTKISSASTSSLDSLPLLDFTMTSGDDVEFRYRLAPMATFGSVAVDRNSYDGTPANAVIQTSGSATINAAPPEVEHVSHAIGSGSGDRTNSSSTGRGVIAMGSKINSVDVYTSTYKPGEIVSVTLCKFDKSVVGTSGTSYGDFTSKTPEQTWELTRGSTYHPGDSNEFTKFNLPAGTSSIVVESDKSYRVLVIYDRIKVINGTGQYHYEESTYVKAYLYYGSDNVADINMSSATFGTYESLGWNETKYYSKNSDIRNKTAAYFVLVADLPREDLSISSSSFRDWVTDEDYVSIKDALNASYTTRYHNGVTKYYYIYKINDGDEHPIDNTIEFQTKFTLRTDNPPAAEVTYDCDVNVEQWNRDTYDGNYVAAQNQSVQFSVPTGEPLRENNRNGEAKNPLIIYNPTGSFYTNRDPSGNHPVRGHLTIKPNPTEGYNVERVQITDYNTYNYYPDANGEINYHLRTSNVTIKVYYSRPLIRISSTNEGNKGKATVDVDTAGSTETVLTENKFTNGTFVTKGNNADVIIKPLTYTDEGSEFYYSVASIRVGDAYNNTLTVYTDNGGDVTGDAYTIEKMDDGSQYKLTLGKVQRDKFIFIQLVGKERVFTSNVQVKQQIKLAGASNYVDCYEGYFGSATLNGVLSGKEDPLNFDGTDLDSVTLGNEVEKEGTVTAGTTLSLDNITAPEYFVVDSVDVVMNGASATVTEDSGTYTLANPAPNSGATVITVKYGLKRTEYTLNYRYYSREWNADNESNYENNNNVIGENTQPDKTYTVKVNLTDADIEDGKPKMKTIVDNAPAIVDLYKDCVWKLDDDHITYNGNEVTITAKQPAKTFTAKFFTNSGSKDEFETITKVKLNNFVKKDGEFIEAEANLNGSNFAYWLVKKAGTDKEITKCYSRQFNLRVTESIDVVAYYGEKAKSITLSDAMYSREQTSDGNGNVSDKLFADFILSYMEETGKLFNPSEAEAEGVEALTGYSSGLVVEFDSNIKLAREDEKGHKLTDEEKVVFPANDAVDKNTVISYIKGENPSIPNTRTLVNLSVNNNSYNNKNRVNKALGFNNTENSRHTVLRAYYYVKDASGNVQLTDPVYFYLYDIGNAEPVIEY